MPAPTYYQPIEAILEGNCNYEYYNHTEDTFSKTSRSRICHVELAEDNEYNKDIALLIFTIRNQSGAWKIHSEGIKRMDSGAMVPLRNATVKLAKEKCWKFIAVAVAGEDTPASENISQYVVSIESYTYGDETVGVLTDALEELEDLGNPDFHRFKTDINGKEYSLAFIKKENFIEYLTYFDDRPYNQKDNNVLAETLSFASDFLSKEWFKEMANNYPGFDEKANELISTFNEKFNPDKLEKLSGIDLLNNVFLNPDNPDNLCRALEFNPELTEFFGSIKGGNSYKYGLFYSSNGSWMTGSHQKPRVLTQDEAVTIGTEIRDRLVAGARVISSYGPVDEIDDYKKLYKLLEEATNGDINKVWFMKYYQMLYPELFAPNYSDYAQRIVLGSLGIEKEKYPLVRMGQIRFFANECELSNVLFSKIFWDNYEEPVFEEENTSNDSPITFNTGYKSEFARNRILFGAPGTGKSFTLNGDRKEILYGDREIDESTIDLSQYGEYERVTFHPDYSYANFVGTYKPVPCKDESGKDGITYEYVPGPFMRTYVKALLNSKTETPKPYLLIIEEINRANVAAVFGDVFQLLDRDEKEVSEYPIQASEDMKKYLAKKLGGVPKDYEEIRIPDNMFIWATMNSADQGVFPMDTAFKRRWDFTYLGIDDSEDGIAEKTVLLGTKTSTQDCRRVVEWNELRKAINEELLKYKVNEDKLMGPYFISKKNLPEGNIIDPEEFSRIFKNKVIMYLFDDAAKQKRASLFEGCEEKSRNQYSKICNEFDEKGVLIFGSTISDRFTDIPEDDEQ